MTRIHIDLLVSFTKGVFGSCCDPIPTTTTATITNMPSTNTVSLSQCKDANSDGFDVDTAIIAGSTVGGCLCLATVLTALYFICQRAPCTMSRIKPDSNGR